MTFIIRTIDEGPLAPFHPLYWTGEEVVGICRFREAKEYKTALEAAWALAALPERTVKFYQLEVAPMPKRILPAVGGHGWMFKHPGYDLMH